MTRVLVCFVGLLLLVSVTAVVFLTELIEGTLKCPSVSMVSDVRMLSALLELYRVDYGIYPESLDALLGKDINGNSYVNQLPKDFWGNDYFYF
jgi:hypothetical protein